MKKFYHKYGKWIRAIAFVAVFLVLNQCLTQYVVPAGLTRFITHEVEDDTKEYDTVIFGQSLPSYGVNTSILQKQTGKNVTQVAVGGQYMMDMYYMIQEMYAHQTPETVVIDIDHTYWDYIPKTENTVANTLIYNNYPNSFRKVSYFNKAMMDKEYRAALFPWMNYRDNYSKVTQIMRTKHSKAYRDYDASCVEQTFTCDTYQGKGFIYRDRTFARDEAGQIQLSWDETAEDLKTSEQYFRKIVSCCKEKGSKVMMMSVPINQETLLKNQESMDAYNRVNRYFQSLAQDCNIEYYNFNLVKSSVYQRTTDDYWDYGGHMYGDAAERFSTMLGGFMKKLENGEHINREDWFYKDTSEMAREEM